jgi:hypothetical protein
MVVLYNWLISSKSIKVGSTNISASDGSNGAMTQYSPDSNVIFLVLKLIMAWLSNAQSSQSNVGYGVLPFTIYITSNSTLVCTPSKSIVTPFNLPIGRNLCCFSKFNWTGEYPSVGSPIHYQVLFGKTFTSNPSSNITSPMLKYMVLAFNLNSLLVLLLAWS